ncbi:hypothetical protein ABE272_17605 [Priestia aryabhattai]
MDRQNQNKIQRVLSSRHAPLWHVFSLSKVKTVLPTWGLWKNS